MLFRSGLRGARLEFLPMLEDGEEVVLDPRLPLADPVDLVLDRPELLRVGDGAAVEPLSLILRSTAERIDLVLEALLFAAERIELEADVPEGDVGLLHRGAGGAEFLAGFELVATVLEPEDQAVDALEIEQRVHGRRVPEGADPRFRWALQDSNLRHLPCKGSALAD